MKIEDIKPGMRFEDMDGRQRRKRTVVVKAVEGSTVTIANEETKRETKADAGSFYPADAKKRTKGFIQI